jgi:hypothetical protein
VTRQPAGLRKAFGRGKPPGPAHSDIHEPALVGDDVLAPIFRLAGELGCRVLDCSEGDLISSLNETSGWHAFQEFRDRVTGAE